MSFWSLEKCCVTSRKEILASNLLKLSKNKIKADVFWLNSTISYMNWSPISCWSSLNPSDSLPLCLINTNQNEHVVLHVVSHDAFQLNTLSTSHDQLLFKPVWCIKETSSVASWALILWKLIRHSTTKTKITVVKSCLEKPKKPFSLIPLLVEFNYKSDST